MASLIYGNKLPELMVGYRTTINESEIVGKTSGDANDLHFGDLLTIVESGDDKGMVKKLTVATENFAGILCATNVKMPSVYPADKGADDIVTKKGEALNCLVRGSIAVKVNDTVKAGIKPGSIAYLGAGELVLTGTVIIGKFSGVVEGNIAEVFIGR